MEFVRLRAHQYQKFDGSVVQNAKKNGRTLSGADAPALPKGELYVLWRKSNLLIGGAFELCGDERAKSLSIMQKFAQTSLPKIYLNYKSYLERKTMSKLHKTFESFLAAWKHKVEFMETPFSKRFFCRKLYVVQGRMARRKGFCRPWKNAGTKSCGGKLQWWRCWPVSWVRTTFMQVRGIVQLCAACGKSVCRNKGGGTGVPQPFLFVGIKKERFGYGS